MSWFLKSRSAGKHKVLKWVVGLALAYTVLGFLILPPIIRAVAVKQLSSQLEREVSIQKVKLNPYTLSATVRGLLVKDKDHEPLLSWDEVYVNLQLSSFFGHPWVLKEVSLTNLYGRVQINKDYTLNISDLITKFSTNAPSKESKPAKPSKPLAIRIEKLRLARAGGSFTDLTPHTPFTRMVGPLTLDLKNFRTDPDNENPYSFAGTTDAGEKLAWSGYFSLDPIRSHGALSIENFSLSKYSPLYEDLFRFQIRDGVVSLHSKYHVELGETNSVASVTNLSFNLRGLKIGEPGQEANLVDLPEFAIGEASIDAIAHRAEIGTFSGSGGRLELRRTAEKTINVVELSKPAENATNAPGGVLLVLRAITNGVALLLGSTNLWAGTIHEMNFQDFGVGFEDLANSRPVRVRLDQINVTATNVSNLAEENLHASMSLRWNTNGSIKSEATALFAPVKADVHIALDQIDLRSLDPYLESQVRLAFRGSKVTLDADISLTKTNTEMPVVTFRGDGRLDDFSTADGEFGEDLLTWSSVHLSGMEANLDPPEVKIKQIFVDSAAMRVIIETNRTINLMVAMNRSATGAPAETADHTATETKDKPSAAKSAAPAAATPEPGTTPPGSSSMPKFSIGSIVISNTAVRFTDRSLSPAVDIGMLHSDGLIKGLSSDAMGHAEIQLSTRVDNVGAVEISGTINPFGKNQTNDLKIVAKNVDLTPTSPYVGKFAGYRLARGKLELDLDYHLVDRKIRAENKVVLEKFTFGEKVESPDATKLPVRLAVAILKDREGKIKLDVPVEGSLDDPKFRLHKVIVSTIENLLTKIATAPFTMLGSLFGGHGEEMSFQEFAAGSAELQPAGKEKLDSLLKGLYERPALEVEIEGSIAPEEDRDGLRQVAVEKKMRAQKWKSLGKSEQAATPAEKVELTADERPKWLKKLYAEALANGEIVSEGAKTNAPGSAPGARGATNQAPAQRSEPLHGGTALMEGLRASPTPDLAKATSPGKPKRAAIADAMEQALMEVIPITENDFKALAAERAKAVHEYLVQSGKVEKERLILAERQGAVKKDGSRAYLQLQ